MARKKQRQRGPMSTSRAFKAPRLDSRQLLQELRREWDETEEEMARMVAIARNDGCSWREIAELTGLKSAQAAQYRWGRKRPSTKPAE